MKLAARLQQEILRHGERTSPEECCGFLFGPPDGPLEEVAPITNAAAKMAAEDPREFTRSAEKGYVMEPREQFKAVREAEARGKVVRGIYHSHVEVGAYFSGEDSARALFEGEPMFPDTLYLVADIRGGVGRGMKAFRFDPASRAFVEEPIEIV